MGSNAAADEERGRTGRAATPTARELQYQPPTHPAQMGMWAAGMHIGGEQFMAVQQQMAAQGYGNADSQGDLPGEQAQRQHFERVMGNCNGAAAAPAAGDSRMDDAGGANAPQLQAQPVQGPEWVKQPLPPLMANGPSPDDDLFPVQRYTRTYRRLNVSGEDKRRLGVEPYTRGVPKPFLGVVDPTWTVARATAARGMTGEETKQALMDIWGTDDLSRLSQTLDIPAAQLGMEEPVEDRMWSYMQEKMCRQDGFSYQLPFGQTMFDAEVAHDAETLLSGWTPDENPKQVLSRLLSIGKDCIELMGVKTRCDTLTANTVAWQSARDRSAELKERIQVQEEYLRELDPLMMLPSESQTLREELWRMNNLLERIRLGPKTFMVCPKQNLGAFLAARQSALADLRRLIRAIVEPRAVDTAGMRELANTQVINIAWRDAVLVHIYHSWISEGEIALWDPTYSFVVDWKRGPGNRWKSTDAFPYHDGEIDVAGFADPLPTLVELDQAQTSFLDHLEAVEQHLAQGNGDSCEATVGDQDTEEWEPLDVPTLHNTLKKVYDVRRKGEKEWREQINMATAKALAEARPTTISMYDGTRLQQGRQYAVWVMELHTHFLGSEKLHPIEQLCTLIEQEMRFRGLQVVCVSIKTYIQGAGIKTLGFETTIILDDHAIAWLEGSLVIHFGEGKHSTRLWGVLIDDELVTICMIGGDIANWIRGLLSAKWSLPSIMMQIRLCVHHALTPAGESTPWMDFEMPRNTRTHLIQGKRVTVEIGSHTVTVDLPSRYPNQADTLSLATRTGMKILLFETSAADCANARWTTGVAFEARIVETEGSIAWGEPGDLILFICPGAADWRNILHTASADTARTAAGLKQYIGSRIAALPNLKEGAFRRITVPQTTRRVYEGAYMPVAFADHRAGCEVEAMIKHHGTQGATLQFATIDGVLTANQTFDPMTGAGGLSSNMTVTRDETVMREPPHFRRMATAGRGGAAQNTGPGSPTIRSPGGAPALSLGRADDIRMFQLYAIDMTAVDLEEGVDKARGLMHNYGEMFIHAYSHAKEEARQHIHKIEAPVGVRDWRAIWPEMFTGVKYDKMFTILQTMISRGECKVKKRGQGLVTFIPGFPPGIGQAQFQGGQSPSGGPGGSPGQNWGRGRGRKRN